MKKSYLLCLLLSNLSLLPMHNAYEKKPHHSNSLIFQMINDSQGHDFDEMKKIIRMCNRSGSVITFLHAETILSNPVFLLQLYQENSPLEKNLMVVNKLLRASGQKDVTGEKLMDALQRSNNRY